MRRLRHFITSLSLVCLVPTVGQAWKKLVDCADEQVVIDTYSPRGQVDFYQIVIRNNDLIQRLKEALAIFFYRFNDKGELIIPLSRSSEADWEFYGSHDADRNNGRLYKVSKVGEEISFLAFSTEQADNEGYQVLDLLIALNIKQCR